MGTLLCVRPQASRKDTEHHGPAWGLPSYMSVGTLGKAVGWGALEEKVMPRLGKRRVLSGLVLSPFFNGRSKGPEAGTT